MILESKYNFNDTVYFIKKRNKKSWKICSFCNGSGKITGTDSTDMSCPRCRGYKGSYKYSNKIDWQVNHQSITIGEVRILKRASYEAKEITIFDNYGSQKEKTEITYMCYETGIGTGTVWHEENLFSSLMEAQAECDKRNKNHT